MGRALSFLTLFGRASAPNETTLVWFPVVGAVLGLVIGEIWWLAAKAWPPLTVAVVVVVADLVLTGGLHFDGLADAGDGLLAPLTKERRLQAMSDPAVGAFGALSVVAVLLLRFTAFAGLRPAPLVLAGLWCASRTSMAIIAETLPYARTTGIVQRFLGTSPRGARQRVFVLSASALGLLLAAGLVVLGRGARGLWALVGELAAMGAVAMFSWRRVGGFTGDVLGAAGVVGETVGLMILVTR